MKKMKFLSIFIPILLTGHDCKWSDWKANTLSHQLETGSWCTLHKAEKMMNLIYETHPNVCVEIGVFSGSSIYPTAKALQYLNRGVVYAIDPWSKDECLKGYQPTDPNYIWWGSIDLENVYQRFLLLLNRHGLELFCRPLRMTSSQAVNFFNDQMIDILHIDGNHTSDIALSDAAIWFPKVKQGGYIWFDDANWSTTANAIAYLHERCTIDYDRSVGNECLLFIKK
jgi:hypothetical protein